MGKVMLQDLGKTENQVQKILKSIRSGALV